MPARSGAVIVRAFVEVIDAAGPVRAKALTDDRGEFRVDVSSCTATPACRIGVSLTGFRSATLAVSGTDAGNSTFHPRLTLDVAPIADAVIVTPTREAAPAAQIGASVTVFDADAIARRGTTSLADLVRESPGVSVIETAGPGGVTSLFMRGGASNYTKVLLDGVAINEPGGTFNFSNISTTNLARVEVVRGAQSALFGSDAMTGVIHLFTARAAANSRPTLTGSLETGGYATERGNASFGAGGTDWDANLGVAAERTDNRSANNRFTSRTLSWSAGRRFGTALDVRTVGRIEDGRAGAPGQTGFGRADMDAFYDHLDTTAGVSVEYRASATWKQRASYSITRSRQDSTNLIEDAPYMPRYGASVAPFTFFDYTYDSGNILRRGVFSYQSDWRINTAAGAVTQLVTAALDWDAERASLTDRLAKTTLDAARDNVGVSVQHQVVGRRGSLVSSLRAEHNDSFGNTWIPRVSAALVLRQGQGAWGELTLKANAGRGVKEPTLLQSFSPNPFFLGNTALLPERARTADIGLSQRLAGDRVRIDAVLFDNHFRDQISTVTTSFSPYRSQYMNIGSADARGVELTAEIAPVTSLRLSGGYTHLTKADLFRRAQNTAHARAMWTMGDASIDVSGIFIGTYADNDFSSLSPAITSSGGDWRWDASARYQFTPRFEGYVRVQNLTDINTMEPLGYLTWRRTAHVGLKVRF